MNIDIQIERWAVQRLLPCVTNPRTHSPEQIAQLAAAIQEWGWTNPILVGAQGDVIAGHARLRAARQLGMHEVPVIVLRHLTETQRRALVIADNQLALNAGWAAAGTHRSAGRRFRSPFARMRRRRTGPLTGP